MLSFENPRTNMSPNNKDKEGEKQIELHWREALREAQEKGFAPPDREEFNIMHGIEEKPKKPEKTAIEEKRRKMELDWRAAEREAQEKGFAPPDREAFEKMFK
jgi:hypothetical protein